MKNFFLVAMADAFEQLVGEALDDEWVHAFFLAEIVHEFLEVVFEVFKNKDKFSICVNHFSQVYDVDVVEFFQDGDFADGCGGYAFLLGFQSDLFEGKNLSGLFV